MLSKPAVADASPLAAMPRPHAFGAPPLFAAASGSHAITRCVDRRAAAILPGDNHGR